MFRDAAGPRENSFCTGGVRNASASTLHPNRSEIQTHIFGGRRGIILSHPSPDRRTGGGMLNPQIPRPILEAPAPAPFPTFSLRTLSTKNSIIAARERGETSFQPTTPEVAPCSLSRGGGLGTLVLYNAAATLNRKKRERGRDGERSSVIRLVKAEIPERRLGRERNCGGGRSSGLGMGSLTLETSDQRRHRVDTTPRNHSDSTSVTYGRDRICCHTAENQHFIPWGVGSWTGALFCNSIKRFGVRGFPSHCLRPFMQKRDKTQHPLWEEE